MNQKKSPKHPNLTTEEKEFLQNEMKSKPNPHPPEVVKDISQSETLPKTPIKPIELTPRKRDKIVNVRVYSLY